PWINAPRSARNRRRAPNGRSHTKVDDSRCLTSKLETARSALRGAPKVTCPCVLDEVSTFLSGLASDASSTEWPHVQSAVKESPFDTRRIPLTYAAWRMLVASVS